MAVDCVSRAEAAGSEVGRVGGADCPLGFGFGAGVVGEEVGVGAEGEVKVGFVAKLEVAGGMGLPGPGWDEAGGGYAD